MRSMRMAALAAAMTLAFSGLALARDHDNDRGRDHNKDRHADHAVARDRGIHDRGVPSGVWNGARNQGVGNGDWRDRERRERAERERREIWEREHRNEVYRGGTSYPGGYGYPGGGYGYPGGGYGYPSGGYGYPGGGGYGGGAGYSQGYRDGSQVARQDMSSGKPYNPSPRGAYGNRDRGYGSADGNKGNYQAQYTSGYEAGYRGSYQGGRGRGF